MGKRTVFEDVLSLVIAEFMGFYEGTGLGFDCRKSNAPPRYPQKNRKKLFENIVQSLVDSFGVFFFYF